MNQTNKIEVANEDRAQTVGEEIANAITHGIGALLSVACLTLAVAFTAIRHDVYGIVSMSIYGFSMFILYFCSMMYHAMPSKRAKAILNIFDHSAIYILIAGSYTPITLSAMRQYSPGWGWSIFGVVWLMAIIGIIFQSLFINRFQLLSNITYLLMGWIAIIAIYPLIKAMGWTAVLWIAAGGIVYSIGVIFYSMKGKFMHAVWHLFVLGGTFIHFGVILYYIALNGGKQI